MKFQIGDLVRYCNGTYVIHSIRNNLITLKGIRKAVAAVVVVESSIERLKQEIKQENNFFVFMFTKK